MPASIKHLTDKKLNLTSLLARWKDGLYYTAAIVKCDKPNKKCLVCFEDGSEVWVNNRDVHIQLSLEQFNEDEDIVCCICDDGNSEPPNEIILCDVCQQGYHQGCHNPPVDSSKIDESEDTNDHKDWFCATCSYILNQSNRAKLSATAQQQQQSQSQAQPKSQQQTSPQTRPKSKPPGPPQPPGQPQQKPPSKPQPQPTPQPKPPAQTISPSQPKTQTQQQQQPHPQSPPTPTQPQSQPVQKQPVKVKQAPVSQQQHQKTTVGPVKPAVNPVQKPAPYYPLSSQVRVVATSSTAALASMTASSALVVGSSAGRTKQDLVNQSNRSSQRHQRQPASNVEAVPPPVKHAVRKSSVNFVMPPVRQSALPTATRSVLPNTVPSARSPQHSIAASLAPVASQLLQQQQQLSPTSAIRSNSNNKIVESRDKPSATSLQQPLAIGGLNSSRTTVDIPVQIALAGSSLNTVETLGNKPIDDGPDASNMPTPSFTTNSSGKNFTIAESNSAPGSSAAQNVVMSNAEGNRRATQSIVIMNVDSSQVVQKSA